MAASNDLEGKMETIDIGGTPAWVLGDNTLAAAKTHSLATEQLVLILDSFNLARAERIFPIGEAYKMKKILFDVTVTDVDMSSDVVLPPKPEQIKKDFDAAKPSVLGVIINNYRRRIKDKQELERRYDMLRDKTISFAQNSKNLREFMNNLLLEMFVPVKGMLLEDLFSKNPQITYDLMARFEIPARAVCPKCNIFRNTVLGKDLKCCSVSGDEVIKSGRFIPEYGFFPIFVWLNGIRMFGVDTIEYIPLAEKIALQIQDLAKKYNATDDKPMISYKKKQNSRTVFEEYLLRDLITD